jgi:hypothetical protein
MSKFIPRAAFIIGLSLVLLAATLLVSCSIIPTRTTTNTPTTTTTSQSTSAGWTYLGPNNVDVRELAISPSDPNTIYFASYNYGVYKSSDGGATWTAKNNGIASIKAYSIAVDPHNSQIVYLGSGTASYGLYRSTDGGDSWSLVVKYPTQKVYCDPYYSNVLYISYNENGLWKSTDSGLSWHATGIASGDINAIAVDPTNPQVIYVGGYNWGPLSSGGVYKSADGGATFFSAGPGGVQIGNIAIDPVDSNIVYAASVGSSTSPSLYGLWKSTNGGQGWQNIGFDGCHVVSVLVDPSAHNKVYAIPVTPTGVNGAMEAIPQLSVDYGQTWQQIAQGLQTTSVVCLAANYATTSAIYAGANYGVYRTGSTTMSTTTPTITSTTIITSTPPITTTTTTTTATKIRATGITIVYQELTTDGNGRKAVRLVLRNDSGQAIPTLYANVRFFDSHGDFVDSSVESVSNFLAGQTREMIIPCWGSCTDVKYYDFNLTLN